MCNCVMFVAWDPQQFAGLDHLTHQSSELIRSVRDSRRKTGVERIQIPGDTSRDTEQRRRRDGIPLDEGNWKKLADLAERLGVQPPSAITA